VIRSNQTQRHCHAERSEASAFAFSSFRIAGDTLDFEFWLDEYLSGDALIQNSHRLMGFTPSSL
jgi:hypothetical protein